VSVDSVIEDQAASALRNEPVQARSAARLSALLDAAAEVIDEIGHERLTTAMVADRARASIGTVYRYFPDRLAVLEGLSSRSLKRFTKQVTEALDENRPTHWRDLTEQIINAYVDMYRTQKGFRAIRFGDVVDVRLIDGKRTNNTLLAQVFVQMMDERFGIVDGPDTEFRLNVAIAAVDALVHRAFVLDADGDERYIVEAKAIVGDYLERYLD
jgi:AcrR family transcriptional regulator